MSLSLRMLQMAVLGGFGLLALMLAARAQDPGYALHAWIMFAGVVFGLVWLARRTDFDGGTAARTDEDGYIDDVIKAGVIATVFWAVLGMAMGVFVASELAWPWLNGDNPYTSFGRLRPVHTTLVIFGFGGNALLASSFYVVQRTNRTQLAFRGLHWFVFWGYQLFIVLAITGYVLGVTQAREYAEPEWYVDLWLLVVWLAYFAIFFGTLVKRKVSHIYVANWFYLAFIITTAMLHIGNNLALPVSLFGAKSYSLLSGVQDAMTQWWYGHNVVGFILTAGFIGMMYYFLPKQAERPVYSYRLSIMHFWALIFVYIWVAPHHLHYTALPTWVQTLGMVMSVILWMPSWGGMINGLMTLSGAWDKLRTDPILRMMVISVAFYGMSTFEGPMMGVKSVNALSHYTDWTVGHVHSGALGWVGMISMGTVYFLTARLFGNGNLYSIRLVSWHFWLATLGIVLYAASMWVSGITQGLMWREYDDQGFLVYSFAEVVEAVQPYHVIRAIGGALYLAGALLMAYNVWRTVRGEARQPISAPATIAPAAAARA